MTSSAPVPEDDFGGGETSEGVGVCTLEPDGSVFGSDVESCGCVVSESDKSYDDVTIANHNKKNYVMV